MLKDIFNRVTFIHGWLFGNYIWTNVIDYFDSINNKNFVTFRGETEGYASPFTNEKIENKD